MNEPIFEQKTNESNCWHTNLKSKKWWEKKDFILF